MAERFAKVWRQPDIEGIKDDVGKLLRYKIKPHFNGTEPQHRNGEVYGEFLSPRFSQLLGFFADDEWVADVTCVDCEMCLAVVRQRLPTLYRGVRLAFHKFRVAFFL